MAILFRVLLATLLLDQWPNRSIINLYFLEKGKVKKCQNSMTVAPAAIIQELLVTQ